MTQPGRMNIAVLEKIGALAVEAGAVVMRHFGRCETEWKADGSPVTAADREAEALVLAGLGRLLPQVPVVSEEDVGSGKMPLIGTDFLLVDALDGTKEFVAQADQFTVNIAFISKGFPVAGAVYAPALQQLWLAGAGEAETMLVPPGVPLTQARARRTIRTRTAPTPFTTIASLRHSSPETEAFLATLPPHTRLSAGSSIKFCKIAEGEADLYPRFSPIMEWDTAAGDAVLRAAGGMTLTLDGQPLGYGKRGDGFRQNHFVAVGERAFAEKLLSTPK